MGKMYSAYEEMLDSGEYEDIDELCNDLQLNVDDLYEDNTEDDDED